MSALQENVDKTKSQESFNTPDKAKGMDNLDILGQYFF